MNKIVLYSPGLSSMNLGDKIIAESAKENLDFLLDTAFIVEIPTHLPHSFYYMRNLMDSDYKFVLGSNLLKSTFMGFKRQWDVKLRLSKFTGPCILVGAGWWQYGNKPNFYTKILLKSLLSKEYIHSVRDEYTENMLRSMGINNVINTACPTMWKLTPEHCSQIKPDKSSEVVFTLTDYNKDYDKDSILVNILLKNYSKLYFWPQGINDFEYFKELNITDTKIEILNPSLDSFNNVLINKDVDYIGTRLHAGIKALQNKVRTIIISIDNRAKEKSKSFNLPIVERNGLEDLENLINTKMETKIIIPIDKIRKWRSQFK